MVLFDHFCLTIRWSNSLPDPLVFQARPSMATNKFRYVVQSAGRARHAMRAAVRRQLSERRARSDAPYHFSKFVCHSTSRGIDEKFPHSGTFTANGLSMNRLFSAVNSDEQIIYRSGNILRQPS